MIDNMLDEWDALQKLRIGFFESKSAAIEAKIQQKAVSKAFMNSLNGSSGIEAAIFIGELVRRKRDITVAAARRKGIDWRTTGRLLGEADALDDISDLLDEMLGCGDDYE